MLLRITLVGGVGWTAESTALLTDDDSILAFGSEGESLRYGVPTSLSLSLSLKSHLTDWGRQLRRRYAWLHGYWS